MSDRAWWKRLFGLGRRFEAPHRHFGTISEGVLAAASVDFDCPAGPAFMTMRVWCADEDEAIHMARLFGDDVGFAIERVEVYATEPGAPPRENPHAYSIRFVPSDPGTP